MFETQTATADLMKSRVSGFYGANAGALPWAAIIQGILAVLSGCKPPVAKTSGQTIKDAANNPSFTHFLLRRSYKRQGVQDPDGVATATMTAINNATVAELDDVVAFHASVLAFDE